MKINPCCRCEDRKLHCHSRCIAYKEWKKYSNKVNKQRHKDDDYGEYISKLVKDNRRTK